MFYYKLIILQDNTCAQIKQVFHTYSYFTIYTADSLLNGLNGTVSSCLSENLVKADTVKKLFE